MEKETKNHELPEFVKIVDEFIKEIKLEINEKEEKIKLKR